MTYDHWHLLMVTFPIKYHCCAFVFHFLFIKTKEKENETCLFVYFSINFHVICMKNEHQLKSLVSKNKTNNYYWSLILFCIFLMLLRYHCRYIWVSMCVYVWVCALLRWSIDGSICTYIQYIQSSNNIRSCINI